MEGACGRGWPRLESTSCERYVLGQEPASAILLPNVRAFFSAEEEAVARALLVVAREQALLMPTSPPAKVTKMTCCRPANVVSRCLQCGSHRLSQRFMRWQIYLSGAAHVTKRPRLPKCSPPRAGEQAKPPSLELELRFSQLCMCRSVGDERGAEGDDGLRQKLVLKRLLLTVLLTLWWKLRS